MCALNSLLIQENQEKLPDQTFSVICCRPDTALSSSQPIILMHPLVFMRIIQQKTQQAFCLH